MNPLQFIPGRNVIAWRLAVLALAGLLPAYAGLIYLKASEQAPPVMPVEAIMLTVLFSTIGRRRWLYVGAILAGCCAAGYIANSQYAGQATWTSPITLSLCTLVGPLAAYGLLRRFGASPLDFAAPRDLALFGLAAGVASPLATIGVGAMLLYWLPKDGGPVILSRWAVAESLGILILGPGLLILRDTLADFRRASLPRSGVVALIVLTLLSLAAFGQSQTDLRFMIPPALALVAIYLEFPGVALGGMIVAAVAVGGAYLHMGIYAPSANDAVNRMIGIQIFLAFLMAVNLPFAALLVQRRRMREALIRTKMEAESARASVAEQQRRSAMAEEIAKVGFWRADFRSGRVEWSDQNYAIFGRDPKDPPDMATLDSYVHPDDWAAHKSTFSQLQVGEPAMAAWRIVRADGAIRHVVKRGVPEFGPDGSVLGAFGTVVDVTELAQAQAALAQSAAQLRLITQNVADIILQTDLDSRITYISPSVQARLGYAPEEVLGTPWLNLIHPQDAHLWSEAVDHLLSARAEALPDSIRCRVIAKDGRDVWHAQRPALIFDENTGAPAGFVDVVRDITESNRMFADLKAAQAAAEKASAIKGEFLANMSHEIRTPLTSISGFTKLAESQGDLSDDTRRYIGHISSAASALVAIVNDVLDFSKLEAGEIRTEPRATDVQAVMQDTVNLFSAKSQERGLRLTLDCPQDVPALLMVDPDRLRQVLINLVGNALKFTQEGGVSLSAAYDAQAQVLRLEVADTGPGIPPDRMDALFQRFSQIDSQATRRFGGTGLGLAISKGMVQAMGGEIGVASQMDRGACFWFTLPAETAEAASEPVFAKADAGALDGLQVLVVDDNAVNRELVRALLTPLGVAVVEAEDGEDAVRQAQERPFDVILMDLRMPGISGRQATRAIAQSTGPNTATPIIAFTADGADEAVTGDLVALGFAGRLIKPFKPIELVMTLVSATCERAPQTLVRDSA